MAEEIQDAVEYYLDLSRQSPNDLDVIMNLAWTYELAGDYKNAIEYFDKALSMDNRNPHVHYGLGLSLMGNGELELAVQHFNSAYELRQDLDDPATVAILSQQIEAYLRLLDSAQ